MVVKAKEEYRVYLVKLTDIIKVYHALANNRVSVN